MATLWPASLPQIPLLEGFAYQIANNVVATEMDAGPPKVRRRFTSQPVRARISHLFTEDQRTTFDDFVRNDLAGGALTFAAPHPISGNLAEMRFDPTSTPSLTPIGGGTWRLEADVLILGDI